MLQRFIVPLMLVVWLFSTAYDSHADTRPNEEILRDDSTTQCNGISIDTPGTSFAKDFSITPCHGDCDYSITIHFGEQLGSYNVRTFKDLPPDHKGRYLMINGTFVTVARLHSKQRESSCSP